MPALPSLAERAAALCANPVWAEHPGIAPVLALVHELAVQCQQQSTHLLHLGDEHAQSQSEIVRLDQAHTQAQKEIARLREENADLRRQLNRHSGNSGQPPSQDGPRRRPQTRSLRPKGGRRPGGQPGHKGRTLQAIPSKDVDQVVDHWPPVCQDCGCPLPQQDDGPPMRRQVHDLPEPQPLVVTEHVAHAVACPGCQTRSQGTFPDEVTAPTQYGSGLAAVIAYLRFQQHLPVARLRQLLCDLFGVQLATGTIENLCRRVVHGLQPHLKALKQAALALPVAGMDETSLRVDGHLVWLHTLCDEQVTYYWLGQRGDICQAYCGVALHDRMAAYWNLPDEVRHALCNAHLLRNLEEVSEQEGEENSWAADMQALLRESREMAVAWFGEQQQVSPHPGLEALKARWTTLLDTVLDQYESLPPPHKGGRHRGHNLALSLYRDQEACLLHLARPDVPFTNNQAERALRMMRLQMKISGCFRTRDGAERFAAMRGLLDTARKQKQNLLALLNPEPVPT